MVLEFQNVHKHYGNNKNRIDVLKGVTLTIVRGEFIALMGKSGCGKSTMLHIGAGLLDPSEGDVVLAGIPYSSLSEGKRTVLRRNRIAFIFQFFNLFPELTVYENIAFPLKITKRKNYENDIDMLAQKLGLTDKLRSYPGVLSGGEQQRVAIARALIMNPDIIIADEPTGNLDEKTSESVMGLLKDMQKEYNVTVLMATHDREIANYASRILHMKDGAIE